MIESDLVSEVISDGSKLTGIRIWNETFTRMPIKENNYCRSIFRVDNLVLKFSQDGQYNQSRNEAKVCAILEPEDYKYFCEARSVGSLVDAHGRRWWWVAQLYVPEISEPPQGLPAETIDKASQKVKELTSKYHLDDLHRAFPRNWTIVGSDPLIFDYGMVDREVRDA